MAFKKYDRRIYFRIADAEKQELRRLATNSGVTPSQWLRWAIKVHGSVPK